MFKNSTLFKLVTIIFISAFFFIVQESFSSASGPINEVTGAPGESNCTSCHSGTATTNSSQISVFTNMSGGQYIPDSTYQIRVRARTTGCVKFGFETTMLNSAGSPSKLGTLSIPTSATDVQYSTANSRDYIKHTSAGTAAIWTDSTEWVFNWHAPTTLGGNAKLYIAMNATDNSGTNGGDEIHLKDFTFPETTNVPVATITTNISTICQIDSILFSGSGTNGTTSYQWTFPGGNPSSSTAQSIWVKFTSGTKICSLKVANSIMNSAYATTTVIINTTPSAGISYNSTVVLCEGDSIPLSASNVSGYTYQWQKDGGNITGATSSSFYAKISGAYKVVVSNNGCTTTTASAVNLTFNAKPQAVLTAPAGNASCQGDSLRLKANSGSGISYYWYKDNVLLAQSLDSNFYAKLSGIYHVRTFTTFGCNTQSGSLSLNFYVKPSGTITSPNDSICQGDSVLLNLASTDTIIAYQWRRNGNLITGAVGKNYYASSSGEYTIDLTTNRACFASVGSKTIKVNALPAANFIDSTKSVCTYSLKIRNTGSFNFQWQLNGITFNTTDTVITASQTGLYKVVITNASGCSISTNSLFISISNAPNANITPLTNAVICSDSSGVVYQVPFVNGVTFKWYKNGTLIGGASQNSLNITDSGNYFVIVDNGSCAVTSSTRNVKVNPLPTVNFIDSVKSGCAYTLKIRTTGIFSFQWLRNGVVINSIDTLITATQSGTYQMKITNGSGCSILTNTLSLSIPTNLPDATITPSANAVICSDSTGVTYQVPTSGSSIFKWYKNGNLLSGATQNSITIVDSGNYFVTVDNGFCTVTSPTKNVKVNLAPIAFVTGTNTSFCTGDSSSLVATSVSGASYQWDKNNLPINNATNASYFAKSSGSYAVKVTLGSCTKFSIPINVTEKPRPPLPTITRTIDVLTSSAASGYQWYKNGNAINGATQQNYTLTGSGTYLVEVTGSNGCKNSSIGVFMAPTGINNTTYEHLVSIFPNPVSDYLYLNFSDFGLHEIILFDASGRILQTLSLKSSKAEIGFNNFEAGVYFIKVSWNQSVQIIRVVKE